MVNLILVLVLTAIVGGAAVYIIRAKKRGKKCIGCPGDCSGCSGNCGSKM